MRLLFLLVAAILVTPPAIEPALAQTVSPSSAESTPVARQDGAYGMHAAVHVYCGPHGAHGLLRRSAARTRYPCDRETDGGAEACAHTRGHGARDRLTDGAVGIDVCRCDTELTHLHVVRVGDDAALEHGACAGNCRQPSAE